jgi:hypothetical protein|tara:strand:- start:2935 stop:3279 length:345 start_codon:yes stop_codon:yes gene_type:complete
MKKLFPLLIMIFLFSISSCKKDEDREAVCENGSSPTYDSEMRTFVESKCAVSGCHVYGSTDGNYSTYSGMEEDINNGKISNRALDSQNMPKNATLSQDELNKFKCWAENDYREN